MTRSDRPSIDAADWQDRLREKISRHQVPGASFAVLRDGEIVAAAAGVLNNRTRVDATPDSLFQIGSITKVWTTTLIMQLVDEGALTLDTPVVDVLKDFATPDKATTGAVTIKHLLTHTSGLNGDLFVDTGRGDDCLEKYVSVLADTPVTHPVGATHSYCNAGFNLAGRVVEVLTGGTWDAALRERIITPLGLTETVTLPEEAILGRAAVGHEAGDGAERKPVRNWILPRSAGPAGLITASARDLLSFVRPHLRHGVAPGGGRVLSAASVDAMASHQVDMPDTTDTWGLGWMRSDWNGHLVVGHDGGTIGQAAFLRVCPERGFAVALLTNGGNVAALFRELFTEAFGELEGITMPAPAEPPAEPPSLDLTRYVGHYSRAGLDCDVTEEDGGLVLRTRLNGLIARLRPDYHDENPLAAVAEDRFLRLDPNNLMRSVVFYELADGRWYLHVGARATPLVSRSARSR